MHRSLIVTNYFTTRYIYLTPDKDSLLGGSASSLQHMGVLEMLFLWNERTTCPARADGPCFALFILHALAWLHKSFSAQPYRTRDVGRIHRPYPVSRIVRSLIINLKLLILLEKYEERPTSSINHFSINTTNGLKQRTKIAHRKVSFFMNAEACCKGVSPLLYILKVTVSLTV